MFKSLDVIDIAAYKTTGVLWSLGYDNIDDDTTFDLFTDRTFFNIQMEHDTKLLFNKQMNNLQDLYRLNL